MLFTKMISNCISIGILLSFITAQHSLRAAAYEDIPVKVHLDKDVDLIDYSNVVIPQVGVDCGMHALKNSIALFNYIVGIIDVQERNRLLQSQSVGHIPTMAECRIALDGARGSLDPEAIHRLAKMLSYPYDVPYVNNKLLILDNLQSAQLMRTIVEKKQLADTIEKMHSREPFVQAFVLGNMDELTKKTGHWIAAVLARHVLGEPMVLYMADSLGAAGLVSDILMGKRLLAFLRSLNIYELRSGSLQELFAILYDDIEYKNYSVALRDIAQLIDAALLFGVLNSALPEQFEQLQETLSNIPDEMLIPDELALKRELLTNLLIKDDLQRQNSAAEMQFVPTQEETIFKESVPVHERLEAEYLSAVLPFNEAELKFRLDRFASPTYRAAFKRDAGAMSRLHDSSGVNYYDEIMQRYPELQPIVEVASPSIPPFTEAEMRFRLDRFASSTYVRAFMQDTNAMARLRASSAVKHYPEIMEIIRRFE